MIYLHYLKCYYEYISNVTLSEKKKNTNNVMNDDNVSSRAFQGEV